MMKIDTEEKFPHLPKAPIIEAVIIIRAQPEHRLEESKLGNQLKPLLPDYPKVTSQSNFQHTLQISPERTEAQPPQVSWKGFMLATQDGLQIAQFNHDAFLFSRLQPYENWDKFFTEALRLWAIFREVTKPIEVQGVGLRFINRLTLPAMETRFGDYIDPHPRSPRDLDLPFHSYLHQNTMVVPGTAYLINLTHTILPPPNGDVQAQGPSLILDIDVFANKSIELKDDVIQRHFQEMRWLKNKVFFGSVTQKAIESCK